MRGDSRQDRNIDTINLKEKYDKLKNTVESFLSRVSTSSLMLTQYTAAIKKRDIFTYI